MIDTTHSDQRRVCEAILYQFQGEGQALWGVVKEARELDKGHTLTLGVLDMCIAALGLADHPERVTALRNRIQELRSIEENH